ncbi:alpha/beta hydrolase family protein [Streptomyces sp. NPDC058319]|uniref:alpha/beta hydrolase family protein n=1 Tax=unclassified Streptomyces TaxID=2593676 RepID=UPI0036F17FCB
MIRVRRIGVTAVALLAMAGAAPASAQAAGAAQDRLPSAAGQSAAAGDSGTGLPPGWRVTGSGDARQLEWHTGTPVPMGDARVEFYAGDRLLGLPRPGGDGRTFRLDLNAARTKGLKKLTDLQVRASGRRLDVEDKSGAAQAPGRRGALAAAQPPAPLPAGKVDPGKPGTYRTTTGEYRLKSVRLPGLPAPVEMQAVVVTPQGATGRRPLALFLHGRHAPCYTPHSDEVSGDWPCPAGSLPIPSHRGYLQDQKLLASQGYVTVSIAANGINGQDWQAEDGGAQARSSLVRQHLARWADWAAHPATAPAAVRRGPVADLSRVLLVGHSRGGEGVNRAAMDSLYPPAADQDGYHGRTRWHISGTVLIGPTIFGQNPVADVPSATLLPGCDGDVSDLQGEVYVDGTRGVSRGTALHSAVYVVGADHNFFNTEWTPGKAVAPADDDFYEDPDQRDPVCSPGTATRLTADQQHRAGATYIAAAARLFVAGDDRVRPLLDGSGVRAPSADPARVLTHAVGAGRTGGLLPDGPLTVTGGGARLCSAVDPDASAACLDEDTPGRSPHFAQWDADREAGRRAVALRWSAAGSAVRIRPGSPVSLKGAEQLALRVFVPPNTTGTRLDVAVTDAAGHRAALGTVRADGLPGTERTASYWAREVRVPLAAATRAGLDLRRIASLELTPRTRTGQAWLMDAWGWRPGTPAVRAAALPRVDVGRLTVKEGDSGERTYRVPVRVSGQGSGQVRVYVIDPVTNEAKDRLVTVRPGGHSIDVPVLVRGNTRYSADVANDIVVKAVHGAVVGSHRGGVTALNDDPEPTVTVTPVADRVTEGETLKWRVNLSAVADSDIAAIFVVQPVTDGPELSTKDVDPQWLSDTTGESPDPERPLSSLDMYLWAAIPAGELSTELSVPTVRDQVAEQPERVRIALTGDDGQVHEGLPVVTGTVLDAS